MKQRHLALVGILFGVSLVLTGCSFAAIMPESWLPMVAAFFVVFLSACSNGGGTAKTNELTGCATSEPTSELIVTDLDGCNGFAITGDDYNAGFASTVAGAGDVNGDGFAEVLVGEPNRWSNWYDYISGSAFMVFGDSAAGSDGTVDAREHLRLEGFYEYDCCEEYSFDRQFGTALGGGTDINGDGFADAIIGAPNASYYYDGEGSWSYDNYGRAWAVNGNRWLGTREFFQEYGYNSEGGQHFGPVMPMQYDYFMDANDIYWSGEGHENYHLGAAVAGVQDVNGDGYDDLMVSTPDYAEGGGMAFTVLGNSEGFNGYVWNATEAYGAMVIRSEGGSSNHMGAAVSGAGDFNGDGFGDVVASAPGQYGEGAASICFGTPWGSSYFGELYPDGEAGYNYCLTVYGNSSSDNFGASVSGGGDINGDGLSDVIIGVPGYNGGDGRAYVVFGVNENGSVDADDLGNSGFVITGAEGSNLGSSVASIGDFNADGFDDIAVGAPYTSPSTGEGAGSAYIIFGGATLAGTTVNATALDGTDGFTVTGASTSDNLGRTLAAAGDVNGDGLADVIIGAPGVDGDYGNAGAAYVVFGQAATGAVTGNAGSNVIDAGSSEGASAFGGAGNDLITVGTTSIGRIDGGAGVDLLKLSGIGDGSLDFTEGSLNAGVSIRNIEAIDVRGDGAVNVWMHPGDISLMSSQQVIPYANYLGIGSSIAIFGDSDDTLNTNDSFCYGGDYTLNINGSGIRMKSFWNWDQYSIVVFTNKDMNTPDDDESCD